MTIVSTANPCSRRTALRGVVGSLGALALSGLAHPVLAQRLGPDAAARWPRVTALIDDYVVRDRVANMVAALGFGQRPPEYLARGTLAFDSTVRAGPDTLYRIYSMTKPVTGIAAAMLIDEGALGLDQPLAEIIPGFANMQVQKRYDGPITPDNLEPAIRPITIRHLLTHTAGFGYTIMQKGPIAKAYLEQGIVPVAVSRLQMIPGFGGKPAPSLAAFADRLARLPLVRQPGTRWGYSVSLDLLGRVIELISGRPFDAFLKERIFVPCGMDSTFFTVPASERARLATSYVALAGVPLPLDSGANSIFFDPPAFPFGGAGLVSSARDYDRFLMMLAGHGTLDGRRVASKSAIALATSDLMPSTLAPGGEFREGFGFGAGGLVGRGEAEGLYGWFGAASTAGLVNMRTGLRQTLMTQLVGPQAERLQQRFPTDAAGDAAALMATGAS